MAMTRSFNGKTPKIAESAFVSEVAYVVGDVEIGEDFGGCSTWLACRGLLQGSEMEIDNQVPWIYYR